MNYLDKFEHSVINPDNIIMQNDTGKRVEYYLTAESLCVNDREIIWIDIKQKITNRHIYNMAIFRSEYENYNITRLTDKILRQCQKDCDKHDLLNNIKYTINTQIDKNKCVIKIKEEYLNTVSNSIIDLQNKEVIKALHKLGWKNDQWKEEFEDTINFDWETLEFNRHKTEIFCEDGNYVDKLKTISDFLAKWLRLDSDYDNCPQKNNKVKVKCKDGMIQIERIK